jgi:hypothetical protein
MFFYCEFVSFPGCKKLILKLMNKEKYRLIVFIGKIDSEQNEESCYHLAQM